MHHRLPARHLGKLAEGGQITAQAKPQKAARGQSKEENSTQSRKGVKGQLPLAGCRDSVPAGAWGNAPTVGRLTYSKRKVKHGTLVAGSEASLRTNSRSRRSGIPQQHKKSTMKMCIRSNPEGDRRLRLFSLPSGRLRRSETICNTKINLLKQTSLPFAPRRIFPHAKNPPPVAQQTEEIDANST